MARRKTPAQPRQNIKEDKTVHGSGPAMLSSSQVPFAVGDVVYETDLAEKYNRYGDDQYQPVIKAHRVFQIDYQYRRVRLRCAKGCESTLQFNDSACHRTNYWHTLADARSELYSALETKAQRCQSDIDEANEKLEHIAALRKGIDQLAPKKMPANI